MEDLIYHEDGRRASIIFNRPHVHNALNMAMYDRLEEICDRLSSNDCGVRVLTLRGSGEKAFVAGTDIAHFLNFSSPADAVAYETRLDEVLSKLERLKCVTIAQLHGVCAGGGAALALACDFRYADDNLRFGVPIAKTLGNCLAAGNVARLIDAIGVTKTKEILLQARMLDARECLSAGVVSAVVSPGDLSATVQEVVERVLKLSPLSIQASKQGIRNVLDAGRAASLDSERIIHMCYDSEDFHRAVRAFLDKSPHEWQGK